MKITDDMLTEWRKQFEDWWTRDVPPEYNSLLSMFFKSNEDGKYKNPRCQGAWEVWQAARRTTPDREAIIEECAKVCEAWSASIDTGKKRNRVVAAAMQGALSCAFEIRALKTAPTSDQGGA
jgi:hypothetical protein